MRGSIRRRSGTRPRSWSAARRVSCSANTRTAFRDARGRPFLVEPPNPDTAATRSAWRLTTSTRIPRPTSLIEPSGVLIPPRNTRRCRTARCASPGSTFKKPERYTIKLDRRGARRLSEHHRRQRARSGDPAAVRLVARRPQNACKDRIRAVFGDDIEEKYKFHVRVFGKNAAMGPLEPETAIGHELGLLFQVTAQTQELATALMKSVGTWRCTTRCRNGAA